MTCYTPQNCMIKLVPAQFHCNFPLYHCLESFCGRFKIRSWLSFLYNLVSYQSLGPRIFVYFVDGRKFILLIFASLIFWGGNICLKQANSSLPLPIPFIRHFYQTVLDMRRSQLKFRLACFQSSAAKQMTNGTFWVVKQRVVVISNRRFGTTYPSMFLDRQDVPKRQQEITTSRCVTTQNSTVLRFFTYPLKQDVPHSSDMLFLTTGWHFFILQGQSLARLSHSH